MSQDAESAIEVTDVASMAQAIEQRWNNPQEVEDVQEEIETEEPEEAAETEEVDEDVEVESEDETRETDESEESEEQEPEEDDSETLRFENVAELAEATGLTLDEFMENIKITRKIDGVEEEVTLAELRSGNQRDADYRKKTTELADNRRNFEAEVSQAKENLGKQYQEAAEMAQILQDQLTQEFQSIDWNALELEDKNEWLFQRQRLGERYNQAEELKKQASERIAEHQKQLQAQREANENKLREEHGRRLLEVIPEWSDVEVWKSDDKQLREFLAGYGISSQEIDGFYDSRLIHLARDAMKNKGQTANIDIAKKRVKKLPKLIKPGAKQGKEAIQKRRTNEKMTQFKKKSRHTSSEIGEMILERLK